MIKPHELLSCGTTVLRVTVAQSNVDSVVHTWITLIPRQAELVAVLEANTERVAYDSTVVLRADKSYDPDLVQV